MRLYSRLAPQNSQLKGELANLKSGLNFYEKNGANTIDINIDISDFAEALNGLVTDFAERSADELFELAAGEAEKGVEWLQQNSPKRSGNYAKGWKLRKFRKEWRIVIYNKDKYQLTHLLEKGAIRARTKADGTAYVNILPAHEHIYPAFKIVEENIDNKTRGI
jgi:hypothetical protein